MKPEDRKKLIKKGFKYLFLSILIGFTAIYISQATGYYEYEQYRNAVLTKEKIAQFEKDLEEGKNIDVNEYLTNELPNYENGMSKLGLQISDSLADIVVDGVVGTFDFLGKMVED